MTSPSLAPVGSPDSPVPGSAFAPLVTLAGCAALASWLDVFIGRGLLRVIGASGNRETALLVEEASRFAQNLAAVLCLVGLIAVTRTTLRNAGVSFGVVRRIGIGGLLGIMLPVICISLFLPESSTSGLLVLVAFVAGHGLVMTYGGSAFTDEAPVEQRVACALAFAMALANMGSLFAEYFLNESLALQHDLRNIGELIFFALPLTVMFGVFVRGNLSVSRAGLLLAVTAFAVVAAMLRSSAAVMPTLMNLLLYGALRLSALEAAPPIVYAALVGATVAAGILVASSRTPIDRRLGFGLLLVFAAGAGPRAPGTIAILVLGTAMLGLVSTPETPATIEADQSGSTSSHSAS